MDMPALYQDEALLVLDKPPGLVVDNSITQTTDTLEDILNRDFKVSLDRGGIVHRLDKDTSGIILVAKTVESLEKLQAQFQERVVKKEYTALVHGMVEQSGIVNEAIGRNPGNRENFIVLREGKEAVTNYQPVKQLFLSEQKIQEIFADYSKIQLKKLNRNNYSQFTLLKCYPQTGRTHQIRVHLKYIAHPIVGDEKYAGRKTARLDRRWCPRQFLHASRIEFVHPETLEEMTFECPLPSDLKNALLNLNE